MDLISMRSLSMSITQKTSKCIQSGPSIHMLRHENHLLWMVLCVVIPMAKKYGKSKSLYAHYLILTVVF